MQKRYYDFNTYLKAKFGQRIHKITVDAGFTCPNRDGSISADGCIYCNSKGSGNGFYACGISITDQLEQAKAYIIKRYKATNFLAYFQAYTNTYAPLSKLKNIYDEALAVNDIIGLSIGTRPDCVPDNVLDLFGKYARTHMVWMEYGLQSAHDRTLKLINRGHDYACLADAVERSQKRGLNVCVHVILGLPGETRADMLTTADLMAKLKINGVKLHLLYVIKDTPLARMHQTGEYTCLSMDEYAETVGLFLSRLPETTVIQRLTADPHPAELVAPDWAMQKKAIRQAIDTFMFQENLTQGCHLAQATADTL